MGSRWDLGEEWWRVEPTLHLAKRPVYRGLRGMGEEWRVFHDSIVFSNLEIKNPWCWSLFSISYCRFYCAVLTANWQIWRQLAVLGKTVNCSGSASLLFYVNSKLARPIYIINKEWWGKYGSDYFDRASFGYSYFISRKMSWGIIKVGWTLQSLQQILQTLQRLRVGTERVRSWYGAGLIMIYCGMICKNMAKSLEDTGYFLIFALFKDKCYENSSRLYSNNKAK